LKLRLLLLLLLLLPLLLILRLLLPSVAVDWRGRAIGSGISAPPLPTDGWGESGCAFRTVVHA
jgi:hypothetical protein